MNSKNMQLYLKKIETRSVETMEPIVKYKTVTDINLLTNTKWVFACFFLSTTPKLREIRESGDEVQNCIYFFLKQMNSKL